MFIYFMAINKILRQKSTRRSCRFLNLIQMYMARHLSNNVDCVEIIASLIEIRPATRKYWMIDNQQHWFKNIWLQRDSPNIIDIFQREFRFTPSTFEFIVDLVRGKMEKTTQHFGSAYLSRKEWHAPFGDWLQVILTDVYLRFLVFPNQVLSISAMTSMRL